MGLLLLLSLLTCSGARAEAPRDDPGDLTFTEKASLPARLYEDYLADRAAAARFGAKAVGEVVDRYRRIVAALDTMPQKKHDEFIDKFSAAGTKEHRDDLVAAYTVAAPQRPLTTVHLSNDSADVALTYPKWHPAPDASVSTAFKGGMLAPLGGTGDENSTLKESPYVHAAVTGAYDGAIKAMMVVTGDVSYLQSHRAFDDPTGRAASPADHAPLSQSDFAQPFLIGSGYADVGTAFRAGHQVAGAFYAAGEAMLQRPTVASLNSENPAVPMVSLTGGTMWMLKRAKDEYTAFTDVRLQGVAASALQYGKYTAAPGVASGLEYAHRPGKDGSVAVGAEGLVQPADASIRPYLSFHAGQLSGMVAGDLRESRNDFYPSSLGGAAKVGWQAAPFLKVGVQGSVADKHYSMAPGPDLGYSAMSTLDFDVDQRVRAKIALRAPDVYPEGNAVGNTSHLTAGVDANPYGSVDFLAALKKANTMQQFAKSLGAKSVDDILSVLAAFSADLDTWDYAHTNTGWAGTDAEIYSNFKTALFGRKQVPDLQCIGAETFIAALANELGQQAHVPIEAAGSSVQVPDSMGSQGGHFVAMVKTQPYGIVLVDWGKVTPTYQFDTGKALEVYQGLQGIPEVAHYISDSKGKFAGYLYSDDGKAMIENMTYHAELPSSELHQLFRDDPESASITEGRARQWLRDVSDR